MPLLPYINDNWENLLSLIERAYEAGVDFIYPGFGVTLRQNQREWYYEKLDQEFPGVKEAYVSDFGDNYSCYRPQTNALKAAFENECRKRGILFQMKNIIRKSTQAHGGRQLFLFE